MLHCPLVTGCLIRLFLTTPFQVAPNVASTGFVDNQVGIAQHYGGVMWLWKWTPGVTKLRFGSAEPVKKLRPVINSMSFVPRPKKPPFPIRQRHKFSLSGRRGFASSARNTSLIHIFESKTELPVKGCPTAVTTLFKCAE